MARRIQEYSTPEVTVRFNPNLCIHAARCLQSLPEVFDVRRRKWIEPGAAVVDDTVTAVGRCPSGALTVDRHDGGEPIGAAPEVRVDVEANGPLLVRGAVAILDAEGNEVAKMTRAALCRCGESQNKPFCDNSHRAVRFVG